jgi:putative tricarboxylic transport membrane protein
VIGGYNVNGAYFDLWLVFGFGMVGLFLRTLNFPPAPAILGVVLGPLVESSLRQSLAMSQGNWGIFVTRPISGVLVLILFTTLLARPAARWYTQIAQRKVRALRAKPQD